MALTDIGKIAIAQMNPIPSAVDANAAAVIRRIEEAKASGAKLVVLGELVTSGYMLGDRWEYDEFINDIERVDEHIRLATSGITAVWGSVVVDWNKIGEDGRARKYNAVRIAANGAWVGNDTLTGWVPKTNLPKYRIFDDERHFYSGAKLAEEMGIPLAKLLRPFIVRIGGKPVKLGLTVCEDLWEDEYRSKVSRIYGAHGVDLLIDISASPWTAGKWHARDNMLAKRVKDAEAPILYVNVVGLQNNTKNLVWFDGDSALVDQEGTFLFRAPQHDDGLYVVDSRNPEPVLAHMSEIEEIHGAVVRSVRAFFGPKRKAVIGLSGGIDSALSAAVTAEALGAERVITINMPTRFNSKTTQALAAACAMSLGIRDYRVVPIDDLFEANLRMLRTAGYASPKTLTIENVQARVRGSVQAAIAQEENAFFLCNGNKTEMALNYFTLYGDGAGAAAFLADLWKGQIYELARHINAVAGRDIIPDGILTVVPSAELSVEQNVDEGKGDPIFYPYHDQLLKAFTERRWDTTTVLRYALSGELEEKLGCAPGTVRKYFPSRKALIENLEWCWTRYNTEFKRGQTPPILPASRRAFGYDRRDTIAAAHETDAYRLLKERYLGLEDAA